MIPYQTITPSPWPTPEHYAPRPAAGAVWRSVTPHRLIRQGPGPSLWWATPLERNMYCQDAGDCLIETDACVYVSGPTGHERGLPQVVREWLHGMQKPCWRGDGTHDFALEDGHGTQLCRWCDVTRPGGQVVG